jgi:hypothetical protein
MTKAVVIQQLTVDLVGHLQDDHVVRDSDVSHAALEPIHFSGQAERRREAAEITDLKRAHVHVVLARRNCAL